MKKLLLVIILFIGTLYSISTNNITNVDISLDYLDKSAIFLKKGSYFVAPFTGWFFCLDSTERLLKADTEVPLLKAENIELKAQIKGLESAVEWYKFGFEVSKELLPETKNKKWEGLSDGGYTVLGIIVGAGVTILITYAVNGGN